MSMEDRRLQSVSPVTWVQKMSDFPATVSCSGSVQPGKTNNMTDGDTNVIDRVIVKRTVSERGLINGQRDAKNLCRECL